jgi:hypothetical protein
VYFVPRLFPALLAVASVAPAADPALLDLIMPDTRVVFGMDFSRLQSSPIAEGLRRGLQAGMQAGGGVQFQKLLGGIGFDPFRDIHEILVATTGTGKNPPALFILQAAPNVHALLQSASGPATAWHGARILSGKNPVALLDDLILAGDLTQIKAAILRRGRGSAINAELARRISTMSSRYDLWLVSLAPLASLTSSVSPAKSQGFANLDALKSIDQFILGLGMSSDFILDAELVAHDQKSAGTLADSLRLLQALAQQSAKNDPSAAAALKNIEFAVDDKVVRLSIRVPAEEVQKQIQQALDSRRMAGAAFAAQSGVQGPTVRRAATPDQGSRVPPNADVMIQSSPKDMGTVVIVGPKR